MFKEEINMFADFIYFYGAEAVLAIFGFVFTAFGFVAKAMAKRFLNDKTKQNIAKICVQFVEQVYINLHGEEKLLKALERAAELLAEKGIKFNGLEMETLIEAAVAEFNEAFNKNTDA